MEFALFICRTTILFDYCIIRIALPFVLHFNFINRIEEYFGVTTTKGESDVPLFETIKWNSAKNKVKAMVFFLLLALNVNNFEL